MIEIQQMKPEDWLEVSEIYRQGIETDVATFEKSVPRWEEWDKNHLESCRIVAKIDGSVVGWAALSPVSSRCVYGGVAEVSVYVATNLRGKKVGAILLKNLIDQSEVQGYWSLQSGIFPENLASIKLHENLGFRKIGFRERIGQLDGEWKDNVLMEKRSKKTGV
ncbi:N-acetyltransferase family protein [Lutimonas sp.]|uniref:GNAT family N-acetyltransferase n=1 Tax=Lutimonas sp. TaxID=1872403 RepID=UPI003D9BB705